MQTSKYDIRVNGDKIPMLIYEKSVEYRDKRLNTVEKLHDFFWTVMHPDTLLEEHLVLVAFKGMNVIAYFDVSTGGLDCSMADMRSIFTRLLLCGATKFALAHNHPSGEVCPSEPDDDVTKKAHEIGELMGTTLVDHIILGNEYDAYYSYIEMGKLEN